MAHRKSKKRPKHQDEFKSESKVADAGPTGSDSVEQFDCCDRCLFGSLGFVLLYVGMLVIFFSERDHKYSARDLALMTSTLQTMDVSAQSVAQIGDILRSAEESLLPLHFNDLVCDDESSMIVMDDLTALSYPGLALRVYTEMFQNVEKQEMSRTRAEGTETTKITYSYAQNWSATLFDSTQFANKDDYYNPQPAVSALRPRTLWVDDIILGAHANKAQFHVSKSLYSKLAQRNKWKNVTAKAAEYAQMEGWDLRGGYLYRPYDKAESYYAETTKSESESESESERVRLSVPRTMIGDLRVTVISLDTRGEAISYLGGVKGVRDVYSESVSHVLVPWRSPSNHKFAMLRYGEVDATEALRQLTLGEADALKLWVLRAMTLLMMFGGFLLLHAVTHTTAHTLGLSTLFGAAAVPFATWTQYIGAAAALSGMLWVAVVVVAYAVGIIHLALTLLGAMAVCLFLNNKAPNQEEAEEEETEKKKDL